MPTCGSEAMHAGIRNQRVFFIFGQQQISKNSKNFQKINFGWPITQKTKLYGESCVGEI